MVESGDICVRIILAPIALAFLESLLIAPFIAAPIGRDIASGLLDGFTNVTILENAMNRFEDEPTLYFLGPHMLFLGGSVLLVIVPVLFVLISLFCCVVTPFWAGFSIEGIDPDDFQEETRERWGKLMEDDRFVVLLTPILLIFAIAALSLVCLLFVSVFGSFAVFGGLFERPLWAVRGAGFACFLVILDLGILALLPFLLASFLAYFVLCMGIIKTISDFKCRFFFQGSTNSSAPFLGTWIVEEPPVLPVILRRESRERGDQARKDRRNRRERQAPQDQDVSTNCPICLEPIIFASPDNIWLPCLHAIHSQCWSEMRRHNSVSACPICRSAIEGLL